METAEPVSYEFPGHAVGGMAPRRILNPNFFYPNPTTSFPLPFHSSSSAPYNFGHQQHQQHQQQHPLPPLTNPHQHHQQHQHQHQNQHQHHHHTQHPHSHHQRHAQHQPPPQPQSHPSSYQPPFFMTNHQQPLHSQPVRLSSEPPPFQGIPDIRPAKNALNRVSKDVPGTGPGASSSSSTSQPSSTNGTTGSASQDKAFSDIDFSTEVDVLMKAIQAKADAESAAGAGMQSQQSLPPLQQLTHGNGAAVFPPVYSMAAPPASAPEAPGPSASSPPRCSNLMEEPVSRSGKRRKYTCTLPHCGKSFAQKTHLDIHIRAHTGDKPFICREPACGQRFSQLGNLRTHQRRHTGEKPYTCDICDKRFAQKGNVRAHTITHLQAKPFTCLLDDCGKQFTQLGNLKSHQNKFHATTLRNLTIKFSTVVEGDPMTPQDRELWGYFATLYKNSNKGIKGRGKDRKISPSSKASSLSLSSSSSSTSSSSSSLSDSGMAMVDARKRLQLQDQMQLRRGSYEDSSIYTGTSSSDEEEMAHYYLTRRGH